MSGEKGVSLDDYTLLELSILDLTILKDALARTVQLVILKGPFLLCAVRKYHFAQAIQLVIEEVTVEL